MSRELHVRHRPGTKKMHLTDGIGLLGLLQPKLLKWAGLVVFAMPRRVKRVPLPLESYQNENKPKAKYLLSCSDANPMTSAEVLAMADPELKALWNDLDLSYEDPWGSEILRREVAKMHEVQAFGQPGLGIGWLISQNKGLLRRMMDYKDYLIKGSPKPSEVIATISLRNREKILKANLKIINKNLDILDGFFDEFKDIFEWHRPHGGTMTLVKVKGWAAELGKKKGASGFCQFAMDEGQIMLVPSHIFGIEDSFFRIGFGRNDLKDCVKALKAVLLKGKPQPPPPVQE
ncbi:hypothetical protein CAPTEDRAFT_224301 [Capitella teleta]|uniref:Aminotransferase class I/classII domain-containing protein n=1 Tax=Capitella teleta TaxID=283909 RepID=R7TJK1_CAPTE|nr:hypothetical protein CAPTEDRAFT_224301 [Capitella teleta]|eukprot:ELT91721.1 hypothetical protein CAPTEDRAFT_224301 [Capitella teleta]